MFKNKPLRSALLAASALFAMGLVATAHGAIKCWTNDEGIRECGNAVPPEYAQQSHETKSKSGVTVDATEAARTVEAVEAEREAHRIAEEKAAQEAAAKARQAAADRVLLDTFSSEDDLALARDGKISHLDSQIKLTESHIEKLERNLDESIERAADLERRGQTPPESLIESITSLREQIADNKAFIQNKRAEQDTIRNEFASDIERFRELAGAR